MQLLLPETETICTRLFLDLFCFWHFILQFMDAVSYGRRVMDDPAFLMIHEVIYAYVDDRSDSYV